MNISVFVFILVLVTPTHAMHKDGLPAAASTGLSAVVLPVLQSLKSEVETKEGACALKAFKPTVATAPTEQEFYESRLNAWQKDFPTVLSQLIARYCMTYVIKDKDDFGKCISECSDGSFELEAIKEYIDRNPKEHIALRFYPIGFTPLMLTLLPKPKTYEARPQLMRLLLSYPQDINARYTKEPNGTALHKVASAWPGTQHPLEHLILLVQYGADLNAQDVVHEIMYGGPKHEKIGPSTAQERAFRDFPRCQAAYILLKSASELDTQLEQTLPDLKARRKVVARHLTILHTVLGYLTGDLFPPFTPLGLKNGPTHQKMIAEVSAVIAPFQKPKVRMYREFGLLKAKS